MTWRDKLSIMPGDANLARRCSGIISRKCLKASLAICAATKRRGRSGPLRCRCNGPAGRMGGRLPLYQNIKSRGSEHCQLGANRRGATWISIHLSESDWTRGTVSPNDLQKTVAGPQKSALPTVMFRYTAILKGSGPRDGRTKRIIWKGPVLRVQGRSEGIPDERTSQILLNPHGGKCGYREERIEKGHRVLRRRKMKINRP